MTKKSEELEKSKIELQKRVDALTEAINDLGVTAEQALMAARDFGIIVGKHFKEPEEK